MLKVEVTITPDNIKINKLPTISYSMANTNNITTIKQLLSHLRDELFATNSYQSRIKYKQLISLVEEYDDLTNK